MAVVKWDLGKELMQCIAFAHFAVNEYNKQEEDAHAQSFYDLFDPEITSNTSSYNEYLGKNFKFKEVFANWPTTTASVTGEKSIDIGVKIVYDVAKNFYSKNLIYKTFKLYQFVDQTDPFVKLIKTECLTKIIKAIKLPIKEDILSSADIYIVKKSEKAKIEKEFTENILVKSDKYLINNFDKYNELLEEHWNKHSLYGVSLKLPATNGTKNIKVVGKKDNKIGKKIFEHIDPYSKFIAKLSVSTPQEITVLINDTVIFDHTGVDINRTGQWKFPVTFKYQKLGLYESDVHFNLLAWPKAQDDGGGTAGFNGQFFNTPGYSSQWVGGSGVKSLEYFLFKYPEFGKINSELVVIRKKALNYALSGNIYKAVNLTQQIQTDIQVNKPFGAGRAPVYRKTKKTDPQTSYTKDGMYSRSTYLKGKHGKSDYGANPSKDTKTYKLEVNNLQTLYSSAKREISKPVFVVGSKRQSSLTKFISEYESVTGRTNVLNEYRTAVVNLILKNEIRHNLSRKDSEIATHYENAQISYFLTRGGPSFRIYLKQRIFLTVFGVITKKSYNTFSTNVLGNAISTTKVVNALRAQVSKKLIQNVKQFDTVPHFYLS